MKIFITGGCGFLGSNLAKKTMDAGNSLWVYDSLYRNGAAANLAWLKTQGRFCFIKGDTRDCGKLEAWIKKVKPDVIYHLAGQVAMTTSVENPKFDFEVNTVGTHYLLEAVRRFSPKSIVVYSSTNKVYGDLEDYRYRTSANRFVCEDWPRGFAEDTPLKFTTPYGCSKGAADQFVLDYSKMFGLKTVVFRHSSIYGGRQFSTYDQGWIGWFCKKAVDLQSGITAKFTISGSGKQVRDVLHAEDAVALYTSVPKYIGKANGRAFNIGGGMKNSLSILELFTLLNGMLGIKLRYTRLPVRQSDQKVFVADIRAAEKTFNWRPKVDSAAGIAKMVEWTRHAE
jgi:CDP-paratose 2-epimerase